MFKALKAKVARLRNEVTLVEGLKAPVQELPGGQQQWIEESTARLVEQFGSEPLHAPIVLPSTFIPAGYDGSEAAARALFIQICDRMDAATERLELSFDLDDLQAEIDRARGRPKAVLQPGVTRMRFGIWARGDGRNFISLSAKLLGEPAVLVAILAHEIGHELLIGAGRISSDQPDQESLTDLLAVFHGFGIFLANASFGPVPGGTRRQRVGLLYLRERALSDALAYYAFLREESTVPPWEEELDWPVRIPMVGQLSKLKEAAQAGK